MQIFLDPEESLDYLLIGYDFTTLLVIIEFLRVCLRKRKALELLFWHPKSINLDNTHPTYSPAMLRVSLKV